MEERGGECKEEPGSGRFRREEKLGDGRSRVGGEGSQVQSWRRGEGRSRGEGIGDGRSRVGGGEGVGDGRSRAGEGMG